MRYLMELYEVDGTRSITIYRTTKPDDRYGNPTMTLQEVYDYLRPYMPQDYLDYIIDQLEMGNNFRFPAPDSLKIAKG